MARVGAQVHEVQAMMEGNINRMLDNQETVGAVEDKSEALREARRSSTGEASTCGA